MQCEEICILTSNLILHWVLKSERRTLFDEVEVASQSDSRQHPAHRGPFLWQAPFFIIPPFDYKRIMIDEAQVGFNASRQVLRWRSRLTWRSVGWRNLGISTALQIVLDLTLFYTAYTLQSRLSFLLSQQHLGAKTSSWLKLDTHSIQFSLFIYRTLQKIVSVSAGPNYQTLL